MRRALSSAFGEANNKRGKHAAVDEYGMGSPTDRLQFGYSPAVTEEAVVYHGQFTAEEWIAARRENGRKVFVKKGKLEKTNLEPFTSVLKLKNYWNTLSQFTHDAREDHVGVNAADDLLEMLAAKQRTE
ncbi:hypothetical protein AGDE_01495 [Angomonas deanei]|nr:hypothetical protein AGDE_01495 [Angomonas deanei]|eukprot:EPY42428.1 hypothetical protein AGDE_01495 [Angomonas deanei]